MATIDTTNKSALSRYDLSWDAWLTRAYAINWEVALYAAILVLALLTRFWDLGARVMSHDESLHTYFCWKLYAEGYFQHTPLLHWPLLFHMTAFF
jgi:predicted membrane-bound mannosyltransferase